MCGTQALSLRSAMSIFFKLKNHAMCATFCRRLLELNPGQKVPPLCAAARSLGSAIRSSRSCSVSN